MEGQHNKLVRIFVGGLGESITKQDLHSLLSSFGNVEAVETIRTKGRSFAYLDFLPSPTDDKSLSRLFSKYNGCVWKGGKLKLEKVKEHYLVRLKRQWDEDAMSKIEHVSDKPATTDKLEKKPTKESLKTKQLYIYFPRLRKKRGRVGKESARMKRRCEGTEERPWRQRRRKLLPWNRDGWLKLEMELKMDMVLEGWECHIGSDNNMVLKIGPDRPVEPVQPGTDDASEANAITHPLVFPRHSSLLENSEERKKKKNPSPSLPSPFPDPQRRCRPQVLSAAASSSSPCPEPSRSARRLRLRRLLGTERSPPLSPPFPGRQRCRCPQVVSTAVPRSSNPNPVTRQVLFIFAGFLARNPVQANVP
ncbi:hypothetical protein Ahy_A05g023229 isoform J [Arachis hypogaea]|uniref:RRM domain-containing protein n=2 Tax=Arachis hypogaea TaxID=3818 RepID=A0A445D3D3_ARAHY|nr:hypothetical protein Ahy_A05g023229 isoform J [Arachis hypogaea]